jgi:hypothetical protein
VLLAEGTNPRDDCLGDPGDLARSLVAELVAQTRQIAPVAVDETAVAAARADPALLGLEENDVETGLALLQRKRGPEAGVAAADDRDVGLRVTVERRRGLDGICRVEPPDPADIGGETDA